MLGFGFAFMSPGLGSGLCGFRLMGRGLGRKVLVMSRV